MSKEMYYRTEEKFENKRSGKEVYSSWTTHGFVTCSL